MVFRVGDENALKISETVHKYIKETNGSGRLPPGVTLTPWEDFGAILQSRLDLLVRNGIMGLCLVFLLLTLFLRLRLAWPLGPW